ncbi:MAG: radical SAM protein [Granulosicoccaceae bacterium]
MQFYNMPLYRPPSEGRNIILQATLGCSHNRCTFCSMYVTKEYAARPLADVFADIVQLAQAYPDGDRIFLADGDALVRETEDLLQILTELKLRFPRLSRVSSYAMPSNLIRKSAEELQQLREAGLSLLYFGMESGHDPLLKIIRKGATAKMMSEALHKAAAAKIKVSATVILGLGGVAHWEAHIRDTAALINEAPVTYLSTLQLGLDPSIKERFLARFDEGFEPQDDLGMLQEQQTLLAACAPASPVIFRSNHASNALPLAGNLPRDKERLIQELVAAQQGEVPLIPTWARGY